MTLRQISLSVALAGAWLLTGGSVTGQTVATRWDFNSNPPDAATGTGTTAAAVGAGTASLIGGTTATFASGDANGGSRDPATGDDSGWNTTTYPGQGAANETAGVQFTTSTAGAASVQVRYDHRHSNTSSRFSAFYYTTDGTNYIRLNLDATNSSPGNGGYGSAGTFSGATGDTWFNARTVDLTSVVGVADNPNFGFQIVSSFDGTAAYTATTSTSAYAPGGTWRFDYVEVLIAPVPEPATVGLMAVAGLGLARAVRRRLA